MSNKRRTCVCGHRYGTHATKGGPCLAADTPIDQRTGQGCQCKRWEPWPLPDPISNAATIPITGAER